MHYFDSDVSNGTIAGKIRTLTATISTIQKTPEC